MDRDLAKGTIFAPIIASGAHLVPHLIQWRTTGGTTSAEAQQIRDALHRINRAMTASNLGWVDVLHLAKPPNELVSILPAPVRKRNPGRTRSLGSGRDRNLLN